MTRKKTKRCPSCGGAFIRGRYVLRITADGATRQRVCQSCAKLATMVLASDAPQVCENCHKRAARVCLGCVAETIQKTYRKRGRS